MRVTAMTIASSGPDSASQKRSTGWRALSAGARGMTPVSSTYWSHISIIFFRRSGACSAKSWTSPGSLFGLYICHVSGPSGLGMKTIFQSPQRTAARPHVSQPLMKSAGWMEELLPVRNGTILSPRIWTTSRPLKVGAGCGIMLPLYNWIRLICSSLGAIIGHEAHESVIQLSDNISFIFSNRFCRSTSSPSS